MTSFSISIAELEFLDLAELGQVAAEDQEVGGRIHGLDVFGGAHRLVDEARVERLRIEMGVRNPGELEWRLGGVSDVDGVEQRPPGEGLADGGGAEQQRSVDERAPGDLQRVVGAHPGLLQHRVHLAPSAVKFVRHGVPPDPWTVYKASVLMRGGRETARPRLLFFVSVYSYCFFSSISNLVGLPAATVTGISMGPVKGCIATSL